MRFYNTKFIIMKRIVSFIVLIVAFLFAGCAQNQSYTSMDNAAFAKAISKKKVQLVDVRSKSEYEEGHIRRALNIDINNKSFVKIAEEKLNKKKPVAVYCRSGKRSKRAAIVLSEKGFTVYELDNGIKGWNGEVIVGSGDSKAKK